jgi:thiol-disulfide isomerase/thioredoxin
MGENRRKCYRYPVSGGSEAVVLRHAGVDRAAKLINLSAEGFRLDMDGESIVDVGDVVLLATSHGFHRVRVVNVARDHETLQLGLQRLEDLPASAVGTLAGEETPSKKRPARARRSTSLAQLAVPVVLGTMLLVAAVMTWRAEADPAEDLASEKAYKTPTSEYVRRRRQLPLNDETAANENQIRRRRSFGENASDGSDGTRSRRTKEATALKSRDKEANESTQPGVRKTTDPASNGGGPSRAAELADARSSQSGEATGPAGSFFDSQADATENIDAALKTANRENKHVLVEFGANECESCNQLHAVFTKDSEIADVFQKAFVLVSVDMESNQKLVARYGNAEPQSAPFLALLDKAGNVLKRRKTNDLGAGSKLDLSKVKAFLQQWSSAS